MYDGFITSKDLGLGCASSDFDCLSSAAQQTDRKARDILVHKVTNSRSVQCRATASADRNLPLHYAGWVGSFFASTSSSTELFSDR